MAAKKTARPALKGDAVGASRARESRSRSFATWTVAMLRTAQLQANRGDLSLVGELCDAMLGDDRIPGTLRTRAQALLGLPVTFEASGDGRRKGRAVRALEADEDWWRIAPEEELARTVTYGILAGICPGALRWYDDDGKALVFDGRNVPRIDPWNPRGLQLTTDGSAWTMRLDDSSRVPFTPGDGMWFAFTPYGAKEPWTHGLWRGLAPWWLLKQYAMSDLARAGERGATTVATTDKDTKTTRKEREELLASLMSMGRDGIVVLPPGYDLKLIEVTAATVEIYTAQISMADTAIAAAVLGHANNAEVKGANTGATAGENIRYDLRAFDGAALSTCARQQWLVHWAEVNFGSAELAPWPVYPTDPPKDAKREGETYKAIGEGVAALVAVDKAVDARAMLESAGVPILAGAAPYEPPSPAPPPATPPAPDAPSVDVPASGPGTTKAHATLASGQTSTPFVEGLDYADAVIAANAGPGTSALAPDLAAVLAAIEAADSPEALRKALLAQLGDMSAAAFDSLVAEALVLADLNGRFRVASE